MDGSPRDRMIVLISLVVVAIAVVVAAVGYYLGAYRPAHKAILTAGNERLIAAEIEARGAYLLLYQEGEAPREATELVTKTLEILEREAVLRQRGPAAVGEVSSDDIAKDLSVRLATATPPPAPTPPAITIGTPVPATPTPESGATPAPSTPTPSPTPSPTPVADAKFVAETQQTRLQKSGLSKAAFDLLTRALIIEGRLLAKFKDEAPKTTRQWEVQFAAATTSERAEQVREIVQRPGVDFARVAGTAGADSKGEPEWVLPDLQAPEVREALSKLKPGEVSPPIKSGLRFLVYRLVQVDESRAVDEAQRTAIAKDRLKKWHEQEAKQLEVRRDLDANREDAMRANIIRAYQKANPAPVQRGG